MKFVYIAFEKSGKSTASSIEAASADEARDLLRRQGLFVTDLRAGEASNTVTGSVVPPSPTAAPARRKRSTARVSAAKRLKFLATFARQLNVLVSSGTPLVQALAAIERQLEQPHLAAIVAAIRERVETGVPLSDAMREHPQYFDAVTRSLIAAGESSGSMAVMLERLAALARKQSQLRSAVVGAMVYPSLLMTLGVGVVILMLCFVLPRFSGLFESLDSPLPASTKFLLFLSELLRTYWWAALGGGVAAFLGLRQWFRAGSGKATVDALLLRAPKIGKLTRNLITARLARLLGVLVKSGVPLLEALDLTKQAALNARYTQLIARAEDAVSRGESISSVLGNSELVNPAVQEAVRNGEASGKLGDPLVQMADFLDEENEVVIKALTTLLEPAILVVLGAVVGLMAMSMFLPLFDLVSAASGGGK